MFEISPKATYIVAHIGNEILIRMLNEGNRQQWRETLEYQQSIAFLPIYLDEDYNFQENKKRYMLEEYWQQRQARQR